MLPRNLPIVPDGTVPNAIADSTQAASGLNYRFIRASTAVFSGTGGGIDVLGADWDNLVILDACRYDVFEAIGALSGTLRRETSRGASTPEFLAGNFANRTAYDTVYISANAMIGELSDLLDVHKVIGLWDEQTRTTGSEGRRARDDPRKSHIHPASLPEPGPVVERTADVRSKFPNKRVISHFLQPHTPFLVRDGKRLPPDSPYRTFTAAAEGELPEREIRSVYEENVKLVLENVSALVEKLRGKTVVTADHGELLGEGVPTYVEVLHPRWPFSERHRFDYGHYRGIRVPELVHVPWLTIESDDRPDIHDAGHAAGIEMDESSIETQLEALGYR